MPNPSRATAAGEFGYSPLLSL